MWSKIPSVVRSYDPLDPNLKGRLLSIELNNKQSPSTTALRTSISMRYEDLWQLGHSMTWTYQFEDFMGHMIKLGHACSLGTRGHNIPAKMMQHYMLILSHLVHGDIVWRE